MPKISGAGAPPKNSAPPLSSPPCLSVNCHSTRSLKYPANSAFAAAATGPNLGPPPNGGGDDGAPQSAHLSANCQSTRSPNSSGRWQRYFPAAAAATAAGAHGCRPPSRKVCLKLLLLPAVVTAHPSTANPTAYPTAAIPAGRPPSRKLGTPALLLVAPPPQRQAPVIDKPPAHLRHRQHSSVGNKEQTTGARAGSPPDNRIALSVRLCNAFLARLFAHRSACS